MEKGDILSSEVKHIDIKTFDSTSIIEAFGEMAFQARNLHRATMIYEKMLSDGDCSIILCLAGSIFSAGLKIVVRDMVRHDMVDAIVSTGAIVVDQDFFEALGYSHYRGTPSADDEMLRQRMIDRIYDTYIDEEELRECDLTVAGIADSMDPGPYSSQEFMLELGRYLDEKRPGAASVVLECFRKNLPIFVPALSDCSAGLGLVYHQFRRESGRRVTIDSAKDFLDLTRIKMAAKETGLVMIGGGVPKNFAQDVSVAADILGSEAGMHKYAIQITVADVRDGGLSGSTLREAHSWGKVDDKYEQMVFSEATIAFPLLVSHAYHGGSWRNRKPREYAEMLRRGA